VGKYALLNRRFCLHREKGIVRRQIFFFLAVKKKKAETDEKKAAIRAEDIAKGVFIPVSSLPQREPQKGAQTA